MMESRYALMLKHLPKPWVPLHMLELLYGIKKEDSLLFGSFRAWASRLKTQREVEKPNEINRYAFESYLQQSHLLPFKTAGARLGLSETSFREIINAMDERGLFFINTEHYSEQVFYEPLIREFGNRFVSLQYRIFSDHNEFCKALHEAIAAEFQIEIEPIYCETSVFLGEEPANFAYDYDVFSGSPVGLRYQVWLDFNKPVHLRPDICSLKSYALNKSELKSFVFSGREPEEIPALLSHG